MSIFIDGKLMDMTENYRQIDFELYKEVCIKDDKQLKCFVGRNADDVKQLMDSYLNL